MHLLNILESIGKIRVYSQDCDSAEGLFDLIEIYISMNWVYD